MRDPLPGLRPGPRWGLRPQTLGPLLKKAGENQLDNFSGFLTDYAGGPLIGSGPLVLFIGKGAEKQALCPKGRKNSSVPGGAARARSALKERRPGPPLFRLAGRGPGGPPAAKRRRPPGATPAAFPYPAAARPRRPYGGCPEAKKGRGGHRGRRRLAGPGRPCGPPRGRQTKERAQGAYGPWARSFRALRAQPPPPPALGFAPLPRWSRGNGVPGGEGVRNGAYASCAGGRCPRFCGSSPGDRRSADRTYRKGTGGPPAFQRGKGRY